MAQKVQVLLVDDLDGGEATETVSFGLDGSSYEIDLSTANADKIRKELALYIEKARKVSEPARRARPRAGPGPLPFPSQLARPRHRPAGSPGLHVRGHALLHRRDVPVPFPPAVRLVF